MDAAFGTENIQESTATLVWRGGDMAARLARGIATKFNQNFAKTKGHVGHGIVLYLPGIPNICLYPLN